MKKTLMILTVLAVGFVSCKKDETTTQTTSEKIVGLWMGDEAVTIFDAPPLPTQTTTDDLSYLNIEFKSDGTAVSDSLGIVQETTNWSAPNSSTLIFDGQTFTIKELDNSKFYFALDSVVDLGGGSMVTISSTIKLKK